MNLVIRGVPAPTHANIQAEAASAGLSQQELILNWLNERWGKKPIVELWILGRLGEQAPDATCPECGQALNNPHVGLLSNGSFTNVVCGMCATSE